MEVQVPSGYRELRRALAVAALALCGALAAGWGLALRATASPAEASPPAASMPARQLVPLRCMPSTTMAAGSPNSSGLSVENCRPSIVRT